MVHDNCEWCGYVNEVCCMEGNAEGGGQCEAGYACYGDICLVPTDQCEDNPYWEDDMGNGCDSEVIDEGWCELYGDEEWAAGTGNENCCVCNSVIAEMTLRGNSEAAGTSMMIAIAGGGAVALLILLICIRRCCAKKRAVAGNQGYGQVETQ